ncbi:uncharacterized protein LOC135937421 [Cloeon dipterum]|uniref:uncharacterized protein LOC135937421 n=1 Tax=Cloeon dipterum TaxID=197152 RepID=UPI00321FF87C
MATLGIRRRSAAQQNLYYFPVENSQSQSGKEMSSYGPMQKHAIDFRAPKRPDFNEGKWHLAKGGGHAPAPCVEGALVELCTSAAKVGNVMGNGGGGGDMGCGYVRQDYYGASSPSLASLPPIYESPKSNSCTQLPIKIAGMSQGNPLHHFKGYLTEEYQHLQNCTDDLDPSESSQELEMKASLERDQLSSMNLMNINSFPRYIDNMIDDHHFIAHMNVSPLTDKTVIEDMTEVAEMLQQRIPNADEPLSNDSMSSITLPMEPNVQPNPENRVLMQKECLNNNVFNKLLSQNYNPPPNGSLTEVNQKLEVEIQVQLNTQQQLSNDGTNLLDVNEFHTVLTPTTLPYPVNGPENLRSCLNTPAGPSSFSISWRESSAPIPSLPARVLKDDPEGLINWKNLRLKISQQLGIPINAPLEYIDRYTIKNPLAYNGRMTGSRGSATAALADEEKSQSEEQGTVRNFSCRVCSKSFGLQQKLNRHMKCHSVVKKYICRVCCKGFNDRFDLKRHIRTHTGVKPYKCSDCQMSFTQRCTQETHCWNVHGKKHNYAPKERRSKIYVCEECGNTTGEPDEHYLHLKEQHPDSAALLKVNDRRYFKFASKQ